MYKPYPGGSEIEIGFDDQWTTAYLPPVGKVPDWYNYDEYSNTYNGEFCETPPLVDSTILFDELPVEQQKWKRTGYPKDYKKWVVEEKRMQQRYPDWTHPEKDNYIKTQWERRMNGVWIAIGNRNKKPTEYYYLTGLAWLFYEWWKPQDFDVHPKFRVMQLTDIFYPIRYNQEDPNSCGTALSTLRRGGKTAILGAFLYDLPSRRKNAHAGFQAQDDMSAKDKFEINVIYPFKNLPDFFKPTYDTKSHLKTEISFMEPTKLGKKAAEYDPDLDDTLYSKINYKNSKPYAYDKAKLWCYGNEEPGKTIECDVYERWLAVRPALKVGPDINGKAFLPTTVEDIDQGGDNWVKLFEDSFPSLRNINENGRTTTELMAHFISADKMYQFDEYGRSVIEDPEPNEIVISENGKRITKGSRTLILAERAAFKDRPRDLAAITRKYPLSWAEAKMTGQDKCLFNAQALNERLHELSIMHKKPFTRGNFVDIADPDGPVEFVKDEQSGRFLVAWLPDPKDEKGRRIVNNVGVDRVVEEGKVKKLYYPKNDDLFCAGADPIKYVKTDDPRASKGGGYIKRKRQYKKILKNKDGRLIEQPDTLKEIERLYDGNFIVEYLYRPDEPELYGEDMIRVCRYFSCSILPEDNVQMLRQHFISRGYERFILYQDDLDNVIFDKNRQDEKPVDSVPSVVHDYISKMISFINKNYWRIPFPRLIDQCLRFTIADRSKFDAVVAAGFTLMAEDMIVVQDDGEVDDIEEWFDEFDNSGVVSQFVSQEEDESELLNDFHDLF